MPEKLKDKLRLLSVYQLRGMVESIFEMLWVEDGETNPDKEWSSGTASDVADVLIDAGLSPHREGT